MEPDEAEFVDRMGLVFERMGGPRTMGRLYGWLMICEPPDQSLTQLAETLGVSKASISTTARMLEQAGMIERHPTSNRQHRYRVTHGGWTQVLQTQMVGVRAGVEALEFGLSVLPPERARQRAMLQESKDFFEFEVYDITELTRRWEAYRSRKR